MDIRVFRTFFQDMNDHKTPRMTIKIFMVHSWTFMVIRVLELDAEFDGQAVVGVVLPVTTVNMLDHTVMRRIDNQVGALCAVAQ